ncbi:hypothetical protein BH23PLA1_BH23PLA1_15370 [soil metagenome]
MEPRDEALGGIPRRGRSWRNRLTRLAATLTILTIISAGVFHRPLFLGNLGEVDPGKVYRSAQPKGNLQELIEVVRPASILNLRGGSPDDAWYAAEVAACQARGIDFYDLPMSASERPSRGDLLTLLDLLDRCRYPLLIHCKAGSDRTGLASGLYQMSRLGIAPESARSAFTIEHGHVPLFGPEHLHEPFREYADWLAAGNRDHSPSLLRQWVEQDYRCDQADAPVIPLEPGPRHLRLTGPG